MQLKITENRSLFSSYKIEINVLHELNRRFLTELLFPDTLEEQNFIPRSWYCRPQKLSR